MRVSILGAGASGIFSALEIRRNTAIETTVFDLNPAPGRKLAVTGSGRGNLTNMNQDERAYRSFTIKNVFRSFPLLDPLELRKRLFDLGIPTDQTADGWVYPMSDSAANAAATLRAQLSASGVRSAANTRITRVIVDHDGKFTLQSDQGETFAGFDALVVATGSKSYPQLGGDASILESIRALGIRVAEFQPALTGLILKKAEKRLSGVRLDVKASLRADGRLLGEEAGNLIFTDFGVNGPAAMNLSHLVHCPLSQQKPITLTIDFLPEGAAATMRRYFRSRAFRRIPYATIWHAFLPDKLCAFFSDRWGATADQPVNSVSNAQFKAHLQSLAAFDLPVVGTKSFADAQVSIGGVDLNEVNPATMESKKIPGLYFAGEVLDCIGKCGGYNLHWAFSTGVIAGRAIVNNAAGG